MSYELLWEIFFQIVGFYVYIGLVLVVVGNLICDLEIWNCMVCEDVLGQYIFLFGYVYDGNGYLVCDLFLEFWQVDSEGCYQECYDLE